MKYSFSIIIVTWNAVHHLRRYLPSVVDTNYTDFEIIIANNASEDETVGWVESEYPNCRVVSFDQNYGYAEGNNRAAEHAKGDILLFLNNDVKTDPEWLEPLNRQFQNPQVGAVQPKILDAQNPMLFEYAGAAGGYIDRLGYPFCRGRLFDTIEKDDGQYDEASDIFWASGAALAIRKEIFTKSGGFDSDFEFHMEEIDLCWRCHKMGYRVRFEPKSVVYHLGGGSLQQGNPRKVYYNYRNSLLMLLKNLDRNVVIKIFARLVLDGIAGIRFLLMGNPASCLAIIKSHFSFYRRVPETIRKRSNQKQRMIQETPKSLLYNGLLVFDYFLKGRKTFRELGFHPENESG